MIVITVLASMFLIASVFNLTNGDMLGFYGCLIISFVYFLLLIFVNNEKKIMKNTFKYLLNNEYYIKRGVAEYEGRHIDMKTEFISYNICVSAFLFSKIMPTRLVIKGSFASLIMKIVNIVITLLFGLWAFPKGPIYTIIILAKNVCGGNKYTVSDLIKMMKEEDKEHFSNMQKYEEINKRYFYNY